MSRSGADVAWLRLEFDGTSAYNDTGDGETPCRSGWLGEGVEMAGLLRPPKVDSKPPPDILKELNGAIPRSKLEVVDLDADMGDVWLLASKPARGMRAMHAAIRVELEVVLSSTGRGRTTMEQWTIFGGQQARYEPCTKAVFDTLIHPADDKPRKQWMKRDRDRVRALFADLDIPDEEFWAKKKRSNGTFPATAASPGTSPHGWWCADDLAIGPFPRMDTITHSSKVGQWLFAHETEFGFGHGLTSEAWHVQWFMGDVMPQAVLDFEAIHGRGPGPVDTGTGRVGSRRAMKRKDDMPIAMKAKDAPAVFAVNGMVASWIPTREIFDQLLFVGLAPPIENIKEVDRSFFRSLRLVGEMPPDFSPADFQQVV